MKLDKKQEEVLSDIIELENDSERTVFEYLADHIMDEEKKLEIIDFLEDNGYIKVDRLANSPVNIETTLHGKDYFKEEIVTKADDKKSYSNVIFLIIGIIIGAFLMYFALKYNII